jgi:hypothetical protein
MSDPLVTTIDLVAAWSSQGRSELNNLGADVLWDGGGCVGIWQQHLSYVHLLRHTVSTQDTNAAVETMHAPQALFPSPFYFFDEVDCALDTSAAARVAAYVRQQCSGTAAAQYLLVSHKPVVFESAGCLLGVYSNGRGSSAAVVGHFERQEARP